MTWYMGNCRQFCLYRILTAVIQSGNMEERGLTCQAGIELGLLQPYASPQGANTW